MSDSSLAENSKVIEPAYLTIDAHVVVQLGAELITDPEQALLELIKNSYDADASWCNVVINTHHEEKNPNLNYTESNPESEASFQQEYLPNSFIGCISIEDDGEGMTAEKIRQGWLSISLSLKRDIKETGLPVGKYQRFPMGDKGLGRVSSMRLGDMLRVTTHHSVSEPGAQVWFKWSDCKSGIPLDKVPVKEISVPSIGRTGTKVEIIGLNDLGHWENEEAKNKLQAKMSTMVSPFIKFGNFRLVLTVDTGPVDLVEVNDKIIKLAQAHFSCDWKEEAHPKTQLKEATIRGIIELKGKFSLGFFKGKDVNSYENFIKKDNGQAFFEFLLKENSTTKYTTFKKEKNDWYIDLTYDVRDEDLPWGNTAKKGKKTQQNIQNTLFSESSAYPGPFKSELYSYSYDDEAFKDLLGATLSPQFIQELSGVAIFRNGFRVRMSSDWLRLSDSFTSGSSFYGLRPKNTLGYVELTVDKNSQLKETSNRENFVDNNEWKTFYVLMMYFRDFANKAQEDLRRAYLKFITKKQRLVNLGSPELTSPQEALGHIADLEKAASEQKIKRDKARSAAMTMFEATNSKLIKLHAETNDPRTISLTKELQQEIDALKTQVDEGLLDPADFQQKLSVSTEAAEIIKDRLFQVENQIEEVYEHVAIGLAAQGVVHDIHGLIEEILGRLLRIENSDSQNALLSREVNATKTLVRTIGKQLNTLSPMLRQYRERKEAIGLLAFFKDFFDLRAARYSELKIKVVLPEAAKDFSVVINKGRLTQVFDNLTRNSEYWLMDGIGRDIKIDPTIFIEFDGTTVKFWDSGRGVRPAMETILFDLFVTDKPRELGQGLGLFIVKELLRFEGCSISLESERNELDRRFKFNIDLRGIVDAHR